MKYVEYNLNGMSNYGFLSSKFSESELEPIKTEINNIRKNFDLYEKQKHNNYLVGNIRREYRLVESKKYIEELMMPFVHAYDKDFDYMKHFNILSDGVPIVLSDAWVNIQEKNEFNPIHRHDGIFSFVIWINVPYDIENEIKSGPGVESPHNCAGMFNFQYINTLGHIQTYKIPIDKSMENSIILFPSSFNHCVYPFFSSDGYRISVSGNFKLKIN